MLERMSSLRCVLNRSCLSQVRNISALAVKVDVPALGPVMTGDKLEQKSQEKVHNYIDLQSSLHQLYKIDLVSRKMLPEEEDSEVEFLPSDQAELLVRCEEEITRAGLPPPLSRHWSPVFPQHTSSGQSEIEQELAAVRVFQWNILAQAIGTKIDKFQLSDSRVLEWGSRRWRLVQEILLHQPDIVCLQEVDHYNFISSALASIGYSGQFCPKPDSACCYVDGNSGPDGCAILFKTDKFELLSSDSKVLTAWQSATNQVVLGLVLRHKSGKEVCAVTSHLKARKGSLLASIRDEQGPDLMAWLEEFRAGRSVILSGDFNAEPSEEVYQTLTTDKNLVLGSSYDNSSLDYTTWKIRDTGEEKQVLDYIFHSDDLRTLRTLDVPSEEEVGDQRLPSLAYASDHLSLVADIQI